ncbi:MAG: hypothetical protein AAGC55_15335, partial [Myxococcota bacterium]
MELRTDLRECLRRSRDWAAAIDEVERGIERLEDPAERSHKLFELGAVAEEVSPERDRALSMYQRAWKAHPQNLAALSRARQLYREMGRMEMVAKLGEIEVQSLVQTNGEDALATPNGAALAGIVGEALLDCGQGERARPLLQHSLQHDPDSTRIRDALAALSYDPEDWFDDVERLSSEADKADSSTAARMLLRAARILRLETSGEEALGQYEMLLKRVLQNDPHSESGNFLYESLLGGQQRWEELEQHHDGRAYALADESAQAAMYLALAFAWIQRFKDRERGARYFLQSISAAVQSPGVQLRSVVAAFALMREVYGSRPGDQGQNQFLQLADAA